MSTLALNSSNDIYFENNKLVFIQGTNSDEEILQRVIVRLRFFLDSWFLNTEHGLPYFQEILANKQLVLSAVEQIFSENILDVEGIAKLVESSVDFDASTRKFIYTFRALTINSKIIQQTISI